MERWKISCKQETVSTYLYSVSRIWKRSRICSVHLKKNLLGSTLYSSTEIKKYQDKKNVETAAVVQAMYFCCIRKIFKRFCKCIQYLCLDFFCLDTFERRKGYFWIFLIVSILMYFERWKMLFETLTSWKMNFGWSGCQDFPLTPSFYFNV